MDLKFISQIFKDTVLKRNGNFSTIGFLNISDIPDMIIFIKDKKYLTELYGNPNISSVITTNDYAEEILDKTECGVLVAENPEKIFYQAHNYLFQETDFYKKDNFSTKIGKNANISPHAIIAQKNVCIGDNVVIEPGAIIMEGVQIGNNCFIGANTTVGTRGFQYYRNGDEAFYIEHVGGIVIEDNVEILSGCCIANGLIRPTYICEYTKIDNLVHIGHSAYLDKRVLVVTGTVIGGSAYIGKRTWVGINVSICASVHVGNDAFICMGAVVTKNVEDGQKVAGNFAIDHKKQIEFIKSIC